MLRVNDLPKEVVQVFGDTHSKMITAMVTDMVTSSMDQPVISMSERGVETMNIFRRFMFERVYRAPSLIPDRNKGDYVVKHLFMYYKEHPEAIRHEIHHDNPITDQDIVDYVAGLTDNYAIKLFTEYYILKYGIINLLSKKCCAKAWHFFLLANLGYSCPKLFKNKNLGYSYPKLSKNENLGYNKCKRSDSNES